MRFEPDEGRRLSSRNCLRWQFGPVTLKTGMKIRSSVKETGTFFAHRASKPQIVRADPPTVKTGERTTWNCRYPIVWVILTPRLS